MYGDIKITLVTETLARYVVRSFALERVESLAVPGPSQVPEGQGRAHPQPQPREWRVGVALCIPSRAATAPHRGHCEKMERWPS